jgi:hypothetical protein
LQLNKRSVARVPRPTLESPRKGAISMAMIRVDPVRVEVRTDWFKGRPREITWGDRRMPVLAVAAVREESSAYPVIVGPRTIFEVETPMARMTLSFRHRTRRWSVEGVDDEVRTAA